MQIRVKLMAALKEKSPEGNVLSLSDGATINDALVALKVPGNFVHLVMVNNQMERDRGRELAEDDELMVMPPVGAG
ncbi:MAG: MoaD/ThiS family protein [Planctomycetota bacterium]|nr:MoaD/ThiS family protein [Planctomycetota bacterium]MED5400565.1 MoaD/ThiS family protein [Planctomycetota bacterium]MED5449180.1 MoaD/ThiS family protein [Planctomycetota bacterium]MEE3284876.1 MoaD/ThiS family protein [Planctomycetota bacterium]MEE3367292.1 MoaD/ThiS family protein [Planctomycetota bacterium]|tara:strand:+ start:1188 stop:1415 length:228 start_codon:yes stop_codon:yes gene_type:complete